MVDVACCAEEVAHLDMEGLSCGDVGSSARAAGDVGLLGCCQRQQSQRTKVPGCHVERLQIQD